MRLACQGAEVYPTKGAETTTKFFSGKAPRKARLESPKLLTLTVSNT